MITIDHSTVEDRLMQQVDDYTRQHYLSYLRRLDLDGHHEIADIRKRLSRVRNVNSRRAITIALRSMFPELKPYLKIEDSVAKVYDLTRVPTDLPRDARHVPMLLMMYGGLRIGEAVCIGSEDVVGNVLRVTRSRQNNGIERKSKTLGNVVLPSWLSQLVQNYAGTQVLPNSYYKWMKRNYAINPHALRHWYATKLIQSGVSPEIARRQLRHSNLNITLQVYAQVATLDISNDVERIFNG